MTPNPARTARPGWLGRSGCRGCRNDNQRVAEIAHRAQHFQPVPERNAKIFEMLIGQVGKNGHINVVLGKPLRVLGHAELIEPVICCIAATKVGRGPI